MEIVDLPNPSPGRGELLIRTHYSAISTGTEGKTVSDARKGYIAKAQARKEEVSKVIKAAKTHGLTDTYRMVMNKLEALQPLGYSAAGEVIAIGTDVEGFEIGDHVACGGASASHGELMVIPKNLCVKVEKGTALDQAAFTTIGAIAMQGIRRAGLGLGENCVVIGLGLIGQLSIRLLRAAGVRAYGVDLKQELVDQAITSGAEGAAHRQDEQIEDKIKAFSGGQGVDAVIITAATSSTDPVELAGRICRVHGKVIVVGNVPTGFSRKAYYRKELDLLMSTSYGPGRYDRGYEEKGLDYPIGQVRWTENRNMQAFVALLSNGSIDISDLITHRFPFPSAKEAFDTVVDNSISKMGVVLTYDTEKALSNGAIHINHTAQKSDRVSVIGAGSFASNFLLPSLKEELTLAGVVTARPHTAENAKRKFGFERAYANSAELLTDPSSSAVVIATRHDSHAALAIEALKNGKRVFLEKPLCLNWSELESIEAQLREPDCPDLMVGFNRRFAPHVQAVYEKFNGLPVAIQYRINAGAQPADHWVHDPEIGGGRIIGEACHFIDLCIFLSRSQVVSVSAKALPDHNGQNDTMIASLHFQNGSIANISYFSNGNPKMPKEYLEVFSGGVSATIDDFKSLEIFGASEKTKSGKQDKGHAAEIAAFGAALKSGAPLPISVDEVLHSTRVTFAILDSIKMGGELVKMEDVDGR